MFKKFSFICMALVILFVSSSPACNVIADETFSKIPDDLLSAYSDIASNEHLDVLVFLDNNSTENYQTLSAKIAAPDLEVQNSSRIVNTSDLSSDDLAQNTKENNRAKIQDHIMQKRELARAVYSAENSKQASALEAKLDTGEILYVSQYSPLLVCRLKRSEALEFAASPLVKKISYSPVKKMSKMSNSSASLGINDLQDSEFSAAGIKIGIVESAGTPDLSCPAFSNFTNKVSIVGDANPDVHASNVAMIILQMVPDLSRLYCTYTEEDYNVIVATENLLSLGVNVINYSMGIYLLDSRGGHITTYNEYSEWFDHIAYNHSVHCVVGAGNTDTFGNPAVDTIAMAYNVITVGNIDDKNTPSTADDQLRSTSSYNGEILSELPLRPDLCAPGHDTYVAAYPSMTSFGGTSAAAPKVTAIVAALCSYESTLLTKQALMKAIIMSSVSVETPRKYDTTPRANGDVSSNYKMYGSGIINAYNAIQLIDSGTYANGRITASESEDVLHIGNIPAGQTVTITLSFLKRSRFSSSTSHIDESNLITSNLADLDLYICPASLYVANACSKTSNYIKSITTNNNSETIIFTATATTDYVICIDKAAGQGSYEIIYAVSWFIEDTDSH